MAVSRTFTLLTIVLTTALAMGRCGLPEGTPQHTQTTDRPIINGTTDTSGAHMAVVALTYGPNSGAFCTGTLIASNVVLTAAHCVSGVSPSSVQIYFGTSIVQGGEYRYVTDLNPHYNYNSSTLAGDIALIRLSGSAPSNITPIPALPSSSGLTSNDVGLVADFSGFGVTEYSTSDVKLHVSVPIDYVCNQATACQGYIAGNAFEYTQGGGGPCSGDSGGPAFVIRGGQEYVAGVTSYGDPQCNQYGVSTLVNAYIDWINNYIGGVVSEDCDNGIDDDGDNQTDCADSDCAGDPACQGPDACETAGTITCGALINDTTAGGPTDFTTYSCLSQATEAGPERAYEIGAPAGTQITAVMTPTGSGDLDLFLLPSQGGSCSPSGCLDASLNGGNTLEQIAFTVPAGGAYLVVETYDTPSAYTLQLNCATQPELCTNGVDDDGDGAVDCADTDCVNDSACQTGPELCANGADDDEDGAVDCADPDCVADAACQTGQELCTNGADDDGDGAIDCADPDCATAPSCQPDPELCANGADDDGDGAIDCADPDCVNDPACLAGQELCTNGADDDGDGAIDCDDSDCATAPSCQPLPVGTTQSGCNCRQSGSGSLPVVPALLVLLVLGLGRGRGRGLLRRRSPKLRSTEVTELVDSPERPVLPF